VDVPQLSSLSSYVSLTEEYVNKWKTRFPTGQSFLSSVWFIAFQSQHHRPKDWPKRNWNPPIPVVNPIMNHPQNCHFWGAEKKKTTGRFLALGFPHLTTGSHDSHRPRPHPITYWLGSQYPQKKDGLPSGKLTVCYWKWPFMVDLPIKNGNFP